MARKQRPTWLACQLACLALLGLLSGSSTGVLGQEVGTAIYLPLIYKEYPPPPPPWGVEMQSITDAYGLQRAIESNVHWVRYHAFDWDRIEPVRATPARYEWQAVDESSLRNAHDNGLTVLLKENHSSPAVHVRVVVCVGSVLEEGYYGCGVSHQLEHLMAGVGTPTRSAEQCEKLLDAMGGRTNAFTSYDQTAYYITVTKDNTSTAIDVLADWMANGTITPEEFEREMGVVTREVEREQVNPGRMLWQEFARTMFHVHPLRYPIIGVLTAS